MPILFVIIQQLQLLFLCVHVPIMAQQHNFIPQ